MPAHRPTTAYDLSAILDGVRDGVIVFDREWRFTYVNANAARVLGRTKEALLGVVVWTEMPQLRESPFGQTYLRAVETQIPDVVEAFYAPLSAWFEARAFPTPEGLVLFFRDVTERHHFQQSLIDSERRFRLMAEAAPHILWIADPDASVSFFNAQWYALTGATEEESLGEGWLRWLHPDDGAVLRKVWERSNRERKAYEFESRYRRHNGEYRWFLARAYPELDDRGEVKRWFGASTDITDLRRATEQIQISEQRYRTFVSQSTEGIWRVEAQPGLDTSLPVEEQVDAMLERGVLAECNDAMARMYGFQRAEELTGTPLHQMMPPDDPKNRAYLRAFVQSGYRLESAESREVDKDGGIHIFQNSLVGVIEDGQLLRAWGTQRDITAEVAVREETERLAAALAESDQQLRELVKTLEEAVRVRDDFMSVASHELKTPLTPLRLRLESLAREVERQPPGPFIELVKRYLDTGSRQVRKLSELVGDLLDVSRISAGKLSLSFESVELAPLVREVAARFEPEAARAGSSLELVLEEGLQGEWDRLRLEQVADNLISNAIKYGAGAAIRVRVHSDGAHAVLTVSDQGIGIDADAQSRIFERFERAVSTRHYGGLGLGLYITRTIVEAMGGEIRVQSAVGKGSTFEVRLPRERLTASVA